MAQTIDPMRLKAAAEHLEWVLQQYPDNDDVQGMLSALRPLIEDAKHGRVLTPLEFQSVPCSWNFADGRYIPYRNPNVDNAYCDFATELEGGLTERDRLRIARLDAVRRAMLDSGPTTTS